MGMSGQHHAPAALYPRERPSVLIVREAGWASELVWTQTLEEKSFRWVGLRAGVDTEDREKKFFACAGGDPRSSIL
jgi:hypothetical protein